jgi:hypothetical protein
MATRECLRSPIPELDEAARTVSRAVDAHMLGDRTLAADLIASCNTSMIRQWVESLWGKSSPFVKPQAITGAPAVLSKEVRPPARMPRADVINQLHERDGFHCRFCGVPVVRAEVRRVLHSLYPDALPWGRRNVEQHAAFQAFWAQYDHVLPWTRGGSNELDNLIVSCAPCNFARMEYTLEEVGLLDPRLRQPRRSTWDGLERLRMPPARVVLGSR